MHLPEKAAALRDATFKAAMTEIDAAPRLRACKSFSELDDICDANCLGGACEGDHPIWMDPDYYDEQGGFTSLGSAVIDSWHEMVDRALRAWG